MDIDIKYWCGIGMEFWNDDGIEICDYFVCLE